MHTYISIYLVHTTGVVVPISLQLYVIIPMKLVFWTQYDEAAWSRASRFSIYWTHSVRHLDCWNHWPSPSVAQRSYRGNFSLEFWSWSSRLKSDCSSQNDSHPSRRSICIVELITNVSGDSHCSESKCLYYKQVATANIECWQHSIRPETSHLVQLNPSGRDVCLLATQHNTGTQLRTIIGPEIKQEQKTYTITINYCNRWLQDREHYINSICVMPTHNLSYLNEVLRKAWVQRKRRRNASCGIILRRNLRLYILPQPALFLHNARNASLMERIGQSAYTPL